MGLNRLILVHRNVLVRFVSDLYEQDKNFSRCHTNQYWKWVIERKNSIARKLWEAFSDLIAHCDNRSTQISSWRIFPLNDSNVWGIIYLDIVKIDAGCIRFLKFKIKMWKIVQRSWSATTARKNGILWQWVCVCMRLSLHSMILFRKKCRGLLAFHDPWATILFGHTLDSATIELIVKCSFWT